MVRLHSRYLDEADLGPGYEHDLLEFEDSETTLVVRSYRHDPTEAHFLRKEIGGTILPITGADLASELFRRAVDHLRSTGKVRVQYLSFEAQAYVDVPF